MESVRGSATIHTVSFCTRNIETTVTTAPSIVDSWLHNILQNDHRKHGRKIIVSLTCKFKPHPIGQMSKRVSTMQLCTDTKCLVVQLLYLGSIPKSINSFLSHPNVSLFGIRAREIASKLWREYGIEFREKIIDVRAMAKIMFPMSYGNGKASSLKAMGCQVAGLSMWRCKKTLKGKCDWDSRFLDPDLVELACIDAYTVYRIVHTMLS